MFYSSYLFLPYACNVAQTSYAQHAHNVRSVNKTPKKTVHYKFNKAVISSTLLVDQLCEGKSKGKFSIIV